MSETADPMVEITVKLLLPVYFFMALVLFFCHCWDYGASRAFNFTGEFIRDLLRSAHFHVLLPMRAICSLAAPALHLATLICISRPERERPQFLPGEDPPLVYS